MKASEASRLELRAKYTEDRQRHAALEAALEAERKVTIPYPHTADDLDNLDDVYLRILGLEYTIKETESIRVEFSARNVVDRQRHAALEAALDAEVAIIHLETPLPSKLAKTYEPWVTTPTTTTYKLSEIERQHLEMDMAKTITAVDVHGRSEHVGHAHVQTLERQLCSRHLLATKVGTVELEATMTRLAAERDEARKLAKHYAEQLRMKNSPGARSRAEALTLPRWTLEEKRQSRTRDDEMAAMRAEYARLEDAFATYRAWATVLIEGLAAERDLLEEEKTRIEVEKARIERQKGHIKKRLHETERYRQEGPTRYWKALGEMKVTISQPRLEGDTAIDARENDETTLVDISSHLVHLPQAASSMTQEFHPAYEEVTAFNDSATDHVQREESVSPTLDASFAVVASPKGFWDGDWMNMNELSFHFDDLRGTSTPFPESDIWPSDSDTSPSFENISVALATSLLSDVSLRDPEAEPEDSPSYTPPPLLVSIPVDCPWRLWERRAPSAVNHTELSQCPRGSEGQQLAMSNSPISEVTSPGSSALTRGAGGLYAGNCALLSDPLFTWIQNKSVTRAIQDDVYDNHEIPASSSSDFRGLEPP
ncbi:hypothetical protein F5I97DRAFT_1908140 [Phlebopus sp. FC_14]|nr:hypothetical protein F5I97DRAFT_1908140 [Phlebopus sp. FC_14]